MNDWGNTWWVAKVAYFAVIAIGIVGLVAIRIELWPLVTHANFGG